MASSLPAAEWVVEGDFNMVEWDGDRGGGRGPVISGVEKQAWCRCKDSLHIFDPNWKQKGLYYGEWFTWLDQLQTGTVQAGFRLDWIVFMDHGFTFMASFVQCGSSDGFSWF
jgi:hypothetical protein